jgi:hypothetical protein
MKIDRSVKVMLAVIALLLAINCVKDFNTPSNSGGNSSVSSNGSFNLPPIESAAEASPPPSFLQVGKSYKCASSSDGYDFRVLELQNAGWVKVEFNSFPTGAGWVNPSACVFIKPL